MVKRRRISFWAVSLIILLLISVLSIAYATLQQQLSISSDAKIVSLSDIRILNIVYKEATNGGVEDYPATNTTDQISIGVSLPNINSTVTYDVYAQNFTDLKAMLIQINNLVMNNPNMTYSISGLSINDVFDTHSSLNFTITLKYKTGASTANPSLGATIQYVWSFDTTPPVITEKAASNHLFYITQTSTQYLDLNNYVTAIDDMDGDISSKVTWTSSPAFNPNKVGTYHITFNVSDNAGNEAIPYETDITIWNFVKIATGDYHSLALTSDGRVYVWGYGANYRCGMGNTTDVRVPTVIPGLTGIVDISAAKNSSYAVDKNGDMWVWGDNGNYALGDGTTTTRQVPTKVSRPATGEKFTQVSCFYQSGVARTDQGNVYTWGWSGYGANGSGVNANITTPTKLASLSNIVDVNMGYYNGAAIDKSGNLYVWGTNAEGELGFGYSGANATDGIATYYNAPILHKTISNIKDISFGIYHGVAIDNSGQVYTWGTNAYGRLGNGTSGTNSFSPYITSIANGISCVASDYSSAVVTSDGYAYSAGSGNNGEMGNGKTTDNLVFTQMIVGTVVQVTEGIESSFVLTSDNNVYGFGYNGDYVLGNNTTASSTSPQLWGFVPSPQ